MDMGLNAVAPLALLSMQVGQMWWRSGASSMRLGLVGWGLSASTVYCMFKYVI